MLLLAYQLEWSKSYARSQRWQEEVELLKEEMWWTLKYLMWRSLSWATKSVKSDQSAPSPLREGLNVYAFWQADIFTSIHDHFLSLWQGLKGLNNSPSIPEPSPPQTEEAMEGIDGGDGNLE